MSAEQQLTKKQRRDLRRQEKLQSREQFERQKSVRRVVMWVVIVLVLGGIVYALTQLGSSTNTDQLLTDRITPQDHALGGADAPAQLIEYSDFQCPACAGYEDVLSQIREEFGDQLLFAYRHFPLRSIHPNAQISAEAAEAAALQGKFWDMHAQLFQTQQEWSGVSDPTDMFVGYANDIGLDVDQFRTALGTDQVSDPVNADYQSGVAAGVNATPTFYLNGVKLDNPRSADEFRTEIQKVLDAAENTTDTNAATNGSSDTATNQ
ncbi:MAG: DsbA family protein [Patescibacteria group bacterium]